MTPMIMRALAVAWIVVPTPGFAEGLDTIEERALRAYDSGAFEEAVASWEQAADRGSVDAMVALGSWYTEPEEGPFDLDLAVMWYFEAANHGDTLAMVRLADILLMISPPATERAMFWLEKARAGGRPLADRYAALLTENRQ